MNNLNDNNLSIEEVDKQTDTSLNLDFGNQDSNKQIEDNSIKKDNVNLNIDNIEVNQDTNVNTFQEFKDSVGYTQEETNLIQEKQLKIEEKNKKDIEKLGGWIRFGDMFYNSNNFMGFGIRESSNYREMIDIDSKVDTEWVKKTNFSDLVDNSGLENPDYKLKLLDYTNNEEMYNTKLNQLISQEQAKKRVDTEMDGDWYKTIGSYLIDPLILVAEAKLFQIGAKASKAYELTKVQSGLLHFGTTAPLYGGEEYYKNILSYEDEMNGVMMSSVLGGSMNAIGGYLARRTQIIQKDDATIYFNEIDNNQINNIHSIKEETDMLDLEITNEIKKINKSEKIIDLGYMLKEKNFNKIKEESLNKDIKVNEKINNYKETKIKELKNNKFYKKLTKEIEEINKKIKEIC